MECFSWKVECLFFVVVEWVMIYNFDCDGVWFLVFIFLVCDFVEFVVVIFVVLDVCVVVVVFCCEEFIGRELVWVVIVIGWGYRYNLLWIYYYYIFVLI